MSQSTRLLCESCGDKCSVDGYVEEDEGVHRMYVWGTLKLDHLPPGSVRAYAGPPDGRPWRLAHEIGMTPCNCETKHPLGCDSCGKSVLEGEIGVTETTWIAEPHEFAIPGTHYELWEHTYIKEIKRKQIDY